MPQQDKDLTQLEKDLEEMAKDLEKISREEFERWVEDMEKNWNEEDGETNIGFNIHPLPPANLM